MSGGGAFEALHHKGFARFCSSALISSTSVWLQSVTVPFVIDEITHSTAWVGVAAFCTFFPPVILAPLAGTLVDRFSRFRMLLCTQSIMALAALALFVTWTTDTATVASILACVVVSSIVNGVNAVTWQAAVTEMVPREVLPNAVRLITAQYQAARVIGPAIAGLLLATVGPSGTFLGMVLLFSSVVVLLSTMRKELAHPGHPDAGMFRSFVEGLRYVRRHAVCVVALRTMAAYSLLGGSIVQLAEPIARHMFEIGSGGYGLLVGAFGVGGVLGTLFSLHKGDSVRRSIAANVAYGSFVVAELALGTVPVYALGLVLFMVLGSGHALGAVSVSTGLQMKIEERYRGRVMSLQFLAFTGALAIGALVQGLLANAFGLQPAIIGFALAFGAVLLALNVRYDRLRILDPPDAPVAVDVAARRRPAPALLPPEPAPGVSS